MLRLRFNGFALSVAALLFALQFNACKKDDPSEPGNSDEPPVASFSMTQSGTQVTFKYDGQGATDFTWDFGDGTTSTESAPVHMYEDYGLYEVTLEVSNDEGDDAVTESITLDLETLTRAPELGFASKDGVFMSTVHQRAYVQGGSSSLVKSASADAWCAGGGSGYEDVGTVTVKQDNLSEALDKGSNNRYAWSEEVADQNGFKKGYGPTWSIEGGGDHGFINGLSNPLPFPGVKRITSDKLIDGAASYTLTHDGGINNADSIIISVIGDAGTVSKRFGSSATSATFTSSDLQKAGTGMVALQIAAYSTYEQTLGSNTYVVINQTVTQASARIE